MNGGLDIDLMEIADELNDAVEAEAAPVEEVEKYEEMVILE